MIKILGSCFYTIQNKNDNIFSLTGHPSIADLLGQMHLLKQTLAKYDILIATESIINPSDADAFLFIDSPSYSCNLFKYAITTNKPIFFYLWESPIIDQRRNHFFRFPEICHYFSTSYLPISPSCYTYHPYTVNNLSCEFSENPDQLFTMISGNKYSSSDDELYTERRKIAKWFYRNFPNELKIYGSNWNCTSNNKSISTIHRALNKHYPRLSNLLWKNPLYNGFIDNKFEILRNSYFSFSFENSLNSCGYISEKVIHSLQAGSMPIYKGYTKLEEFIPNNLFINYADFPNMETLRQHCQNYLTKNRYQFVKSLDNFLNSDSFNIFSHRSFVHSMVPVLRSYFS